MTATATRPRTAPATSSQPTSSRPAPTRPRTGHGLWWVSPVGILAIVVPSSLLLTLQMSDLDFRLFYRSPKSFDLPYAELFLGAALVLALGIVLPTVLMRGRWRPGWPALSEPQVDVVARSARVCFWLTVAGYVAFAAVGVARGATPSLILSVVTQQNNFSGDLKRVFAPVTGVTSLTQVGIAFVILGALVQVQRPSRQMRRRLLVVVLLGVVRAFLLTERLAMLELLVPLLVVLCARARQRPSRSLLRRALPAAPALFLPLLLVLFGAFEYSRSWVFFRSRTTLSFPQFVLTRFAGYYATSYNNGQLSLTYGLPKGQLPYSSLAGFWTAPGVAQLHLYERLNGGVPSDSLTSILDQHATPEFNNPGGLAVPLRDFGTVGGMVFFLVCGLVVGAAYVGFRRGSPAGLMVYPMFFTGLAELPRYLYWTQGRTIPALVALLVVARLVRRAGATPERTPASRPPSLERVRRLGRRGRGRPARRPRTAVAPRRRTAGVSAAGPG